MQELSGAYNPAPRAGDNNPLYFTVNHDGRLLHCSDETASWIREILELPLPDAMNDHMNPHPANIHAGDLFKDPSQISRAVKQVSEQGQYIEINAVVKQKNNACCSAVLFAAAVKGAGENRDDAVLCVVRLLARKQRAASFLEYERRDIWGKVWAHTFNSGELRPPINESLRLMGEYLNADKIYILNNKGDDSALKIDFEWCNTGIPRLIDSTVPSPADKDCPADFLFITRRKEPTHIENTTELIPRFAAAFADREVKSLLITPYFQPGMYSMYLVAESNSALNKWNHEDKIFAHELSMFLASIIAYRRAEATKKGSEQALETLLSYLESSIFLLKRSNAEIIFANRVFMGFMGDDVVGKSCFDPDEQDLGAIFSELASNEKTRNWTPGEGKLRFECFLPAQYRWMLLECELMPLGGDDDYLLCSALDITSRKEEEQRLKRLSLTDPVSGAFYMRVGMERLEKALHEPADSRAELSLACISLDNYHRLHSDAGTERAEEILSFLVRTIQREYGEHQVTRLNLNELMLYLPHTSVEECRPRFLSLRQSLRNKRDASYSLYELSISFGFAESNEMNRKSGAQLLLEARQDLYREQNRNAPGVLPIML